MKSIPGKIKWLNEDSCASISARPDAFQIEAAPGTNLFVSPAGEIPELNAPMALFEPGGVYLFSARVEAQLASTFDAGALVVHSGDQSWAKLAYERSPQGDAMVVSVVTKDSSDDVNHLIVGSTGMYLRIARLGDQVYAFHHSNDGVIWLLARYFELPSDHSARIGFSSQSPTGSGLISTFTEIRYNEELLADLRSGA